MSSIPWLAFVAFAGVFGWLLWRTIARARQQAREREQRAMERGWTYTKGGKPGLVYTVEGSQGGTVWSMEAYQRGNQSQGRTLWRAPSMRLDGGEVYVGSRTLVAFFKKPLGQKILRFGLQVSGQAAPSSSLLETLLAGGAEVDTGDPDFAECYAVLASDSGQAFRLLTGEARRSMLGWEQAHGRTKRRQGLLTVMWNGDGLAVTWSGGTPLQADDLSGFVELALGLASNLGGNW